ncbi:NrdH-redoxin [Candidatus Uhrbacteria bacterium RIFCSPLOWO2_12_FULL_46_10]|uniref:NrdH-redoxin n=1 Tax=Candidatus Uhrbacteria bacterium RIFCSPLOWO2_01_FULL_47_25 TaxID=1802402 RepID=A0A1F7UTI9_9BACT|nr:MAG: NrdH-redoxin [Candidatus Uhrbacteria bacterium RIFCSPHIGHO2_01_FULL_46_23]OGL70185.1 MAG: NrdH-redoxin [Candidatus Uhrbacteria bacterium RIFCSPHIGHO2_02_FULL_47_29]OGL76249.1 MAG: NrdH-redoxin [Candidatus Uhrbacteria bacterium RIFCSPHIGHO2_12_FULL_46_13]OGL81623.1 MAG: NrdH-redoxin [Candidatus Uhrbacteria bacterium RIFCSPLOWO2_01_FULL_47_25]OGL84812.1 MAG: NrdH-redoxin [Candidatus Uhrbacteria bacterium RIFCSPLOWO2_02_FULL_46_19]OGL91271.1 MAG: NrdH-redoxin [Candidatus Uhrbacteria bacte
MPSVIIYTTITCPYCKMAKAFFKEHNVEFVEKDVTSDVAAQQEMISKSNQLAVPVIDVGGQIVVGFQQPKLKELLGIT